MWSGRMTDSLDEDVPDSLLRAFIAIEIAPDGRAALAV
jgi:hypothetical protein